MPHASKAPRRLSALLLSFILAVPADAALIVRSGPTALGPSAVAGAAVNVAQFMPEWTASFSSFLTSPNPDPAAVRAIARTLATLNLDDPAVKEQIKPLTIALRRAVHPILAKPIPPQATEDQLEDVDTRLEVLNYPAVRALLTEEQQGKIGAASWAFNRTLWEPTGTEWVRKKRSLDETIALIQGELDAPRKDPRADASVVFGPGPDLEVAVLKGDISHAKADAVVTTVQEKHLCAGGVNNTINKANSCFAASLSKGPDLKDGDSVLVKGDGQGPIDKVLFVADKYERPLSDVVYDSLKAADKEGLTSVAVPAMRTGSVFGAVEKSYREIVLEMRHGVERFLAEARTSLQKISFVVYNDEKLAAHLQNAFTEKTERERSLRTDLREAKLSGEGFTLTPVAAAVKDRTSPVYKSILKPWDLRHLLVSHKPVKIETIEDRDAFSKPGVTSVLNMPIKMPNSEIRVPKELEQFREFLQKIIDHEKAVNPRMDDFYMYLTVDQHAVKKGLTHRRPGVHIDGVQGARYKVKIPPEHLYSASDKLGTVFYDQTFDLTQLDPAKQHVHAELERQALESNARATPAYDIAFWDSYSVHRADLAPEDLFRTFVRVEFSMKQYDSEGDTHNPLFDYDWNPVARPIPADLDDRPVEARSLGAVAEPGPALAKWRRLKAYGRGVWNQFWWNVGPPLKGVWRGYRAALELERAEGKEPAVKNPRAFFRGLRLLGTTGRITSSAGFAAGDAVVLAEARALFAKHVDADDAGREAFARFLERAAAYNPGKRRTKTRSMIVHYMREGSVLPKEELAAYYDGLAKDDDKLAQARSRKDDVMADFKKTADRVILEANNHAPAGRRVLGALVFGSYANGAVRPGSDIDLQFITEDGEAPVGDLPGALRREWAKLHRIDLEIISFTYVPPDAVLLTQIHPEPILVVSPYADVSARFRRDLPVALPVPARKVSPAGKLVRAALDLWMRLLLGTADLASAFEPRAIPERSGYEAALDALGPDVPHTIKDVKRYVLENLGRDAVEGKDRAEYYLVEGDGGEARRGLEKRGWTLGAPLEKEVGFHQVLRATTPEGKSAFVVLRVNGADRMIHMRSFLKLLGVPGTRVHSLPGFRSWKKEYRAAFKKEGYVPDSVVYGMADGALSSLLALDPGATVRERTIGTAGLDVAGLPMTVVTLSDGRKVWLFKALYGRLAGDLMEALLEHGARRVTALGAAGALGAESRVGDWYTPAVLESSGRRVDLSFIKEVPGVPRAGVQLHVATPNGGTKAWLETAGKRGVGFVDSELESIAAAFAKHPGAELRLAQVVTEVMTGPNRVDLTETTMDDPGRAAEVGKILAASVGLALPFETGYDAALAGVKPGVKHTLKDLERYIRESVPQGVVDAKRTGEHFYIVEGDGAEARKKLEMRGWSLGEPLPRKEGFRQFYPATTPEGERAIVALHVNGGDRVIHIQSYLKLMGVPGERVHTLRGFRSWKKEYAATFKALGYVPDGVVYGLPWTVVHRLLARDPSTDYEALKGFRREFNPAPNGIPENDLAFRPMKVLELADGRRYWFFMHLYGEQAGDLMAALREHGVRAATVLGSAGSLDPRSKVGDWITGVDGRLHVPSPSVETEEWRAAAERSGAKFVEVELEHILKEAGPDFAVTAAYVVSDVLSGPNHTDVTETVIENIPGMAEHVDAIVGESLGLKGPLQIESVRNVPFRKP